MKTKPVHLLFSFTFCLILCARISYGQDEAGDSLKIKSVLTMLGKILKDDRSDSLNPAIFVLGNTECHTCKETKRIFIEKGIRFTEVDIMKDMRVFNLVHDIVVKEEKSMKISYGYPVIAAGGELYYKIPDVALLAEKIKLWQQEIQR